VTNIRKICTFKQNVLDSKMALVCVTFWSYHKNQLDFINDFGTIHPNLQLQFFYIIFIFLLAFQNFKVTALRITKI